MIIADLLAPQRIRLRIEATSRKKILECVSSLLAESSDALSQRTVFDGLYDREKIGSTGLGSGVALPHARLEHVEEATAAFVTLVQGVDFDAPDGGPVDLVFALLVPQECTDQHLEILAAAARYFSDATVRARLREAASGERVADLLGAAQHA